MKLKYLLLLLLCPFFSACNSSDDVLDIFTSNTWKLTGIFDNKNWDSPSKDYTSKDYDASWELLRKDKSSFTLTFQGTEVDNEGMGEYSGRAATVTVNGGWTANGKNNKLSMSSKVNAGSEPDILGKVFINAIINAYKYEGDTNGNLRIFFEEGQNKKFLLFHGVK